MFAADLFESLDNDDYRAAVFSCIPVWELEGATKFDYRTLQKVSPALWKIPKEWNTWSGETQKSRTRVAKTNTDHLVC